MGNWEMKIEERKFFYLGNEIRIQIYIFFIVVHPNGKY